MIILAVDLCNLLPFANLFLKALACSPSFSAHVGFLGLASDVLCSSSPHAMSITASAALLTSSGFKHSVSEAEVHTLDAVMTVFPGRIGVHPSSPTSSRSAAGALRSFACESFLLLTLTHKVSNTVALLLVMQHEQRVDSIHSGCAGSCNARATPGEFLPLCLSLVSPFLFLRGQLPTSDEPSSHAACP